MRLHFRFLACAGLPLMASACATFGTNVEGAFQCRAPNGDCAPSHVLDTRATSAMTNTHSPQPGGSRPAMAVAAGDQARTSERTLRIVFPARVDEAGTLHDEAVAWAVIENPRWAVELHRKPGETAAPPLLRQLKRQLKAAQAYVRPEAQTAAQTDPQTGAQPGTVLAADRESDARLEPSDEGALDADVTVHPDTISDLFPLVSPPVFPSPVGETVAGADAPAAGGFHASASPHDRASRPSHTSPPLIFPSIQAIEAARRDAAANSTEQSQQEQPRQAQSPKEQH